MKPVMFSMCWAAALAIMLLLVAAYSALCLFALAAACLASGRDGIEGLMDRILIWLDAMRT